MIDSPSTTIFASNWTIVPHIGVSNLSGLSDVDLTGQANNDLLFRSGGLWIDTAGLLTWDGSNLSIVGATAQLILPQNNNPANPSIAFGDGNTGFYEVIDNLLGVSVNSSVRWQFSVNNFQAAAGGGPSLRNVAGSATVPIFTIRLDEDTGIGSGAADQLSLIAGGVEGIRITEVAAAITVDVTGALTVTRSVTGILTPFMTLDNTSAVGQTGLEFNINGTLRGKIRVDSVGNQNYIAGGGDHNFFTGGDSGAGGTVVAVITAGGHFKLPSNSTFPGAASGNAFIYHDANLGLIMFGEGTTDDFHLVNKSGSSVMTVPTGTKNVNFAGAVTVAETLFLQERATAAADVAGDGQFWVRNDVPNTPMFTDDAGTDFVLTALGGAGAAVTKHKTADTIKTTDATPSDDPHLTGWSLDAASYYKVTGVLFVQVAASTTPNFKFIFDFSQSPNLDQRRLMLTGTDDTSTPNQFHDSASITDTFIVDIDSNKFVTLWIAGFFETHATLSSVVDFQWAQGTSSGFSTTLKDGSWITIEKMN